MVPVSLDKFHESLYTVYWEFLTVGIVYKALADIFLPVKDIPIYHPLISLPSVGLTNYSTSGWPWQ
jgi:hypothetical protein